MDHITAAEFDSDESLANARGKDGMKKHWVPRREYEILKESYEEKLERYRENISDMRDLRDEARRAVVEREREIDELRERLSANDRQPAPGPQANSRLKRPAGEWGPGTESFGCLQEEEDGGPIHGPRPNKAYPRTTR